MPNKMSDTAKAAIAAAVIASGAAVGASALLLTDETTAEVANVEADASIPDNAFGIADKDGMKRGWAKNGAGAQKLLKRAKEFKGDPQRIDVFAAEACPSGLGYEVFTADAGYASECLPEGIFPAEDAGLPAEATDAAF